MAQRVPKFQKFGYATASLLHAVEKVRKAGMRFLSHRANHRHRINNVDITLSIPSSAADEQAVNVRL
jgi:hypothetical protein